MVKTLEERFKEIPLDPDQIKAVKKAIRADKVAKKAEARRKAKTELVNKLSLEEIQSIMDKHLNKKITNDSDNFDDPKKFIEAVKNKDTVYLDESRIHLEVVNKQNKILGDYIVVYRNWTRDLGTDNEKTSANKLISFAENHPEFFK